MADLRTAIKTAIQFADRSQTMPILGHVLVKDRRVVACDLNAEIEIAVEEDFGIRAALPASRIAPLADLLGQAAIKSGKACVIIRHGKSRYRLPALPAEDFPRIAAAGGPIATLTLDAGELAGWLTKALTAAAKDDIRYYLNGVLIEQAEGELNVAAADGYRLIAQRLNARASADFAAILPREAVSRMVKWLGEGEVTASVFQGVVALEMPGSRLLVKCIDGRFPDWKALIHDPPCAAVVETAALLDAVRRAANYAPKQLNGARIEVGEGEVVITARDDEDGSEARIVVAAETHAAAAFGVNLRYLEDAVKSADADRIGIRCDGEEDRPLRIEPEPRRDGYIHIVMPMRL